MTGDSVRGHIANALQLLTLSHDADTVEAACVRLHKALRQIDADARRAVAT